MGKYFGTDGFRGEANKELTADHAYKTGRFLGWYNKTIKKIEKPRIVIGKDTRLSSYMLEYSLIAGLTASGADAYMLHVTTTPSVAYITRVDRFDCGIMISASHNPYYDNGIKIIDKNGEKALECLTDSIESFLDGQLEIDGNIYSELPFAKKEFIGKTVDYISGRNRYIAYLISLGLFSFRGIKVGLDCANGSAWSIAKAVFDSLGAATYIINASPSGVNINENSGSTHIEVLQKHVVDNSLDIGFAYDGDADRCICVDEKGNIISGDGILYICSKYLKERNKLNGNTVVTTVMSNFGLYKALDKLKIKHIQTNVGDRFVREKMLDNSCSLGGEESGHIIFSEYATTGDGILTSLKLMEIMIAEKIPMSKLTDGLYLYPQITLNLKVNDKKRAANDPDVIEKVKNAELKLGNNGRILVRESGTEPKIRIMVESETEKECKEIAESVSEVIKQKGYCI